MDDSLSSTNYMRPNSLSSRAANDDDSSSEGSGWTLYLVDFIANDDDGDVDTSSFSGFQSSSALRNHDKLICKRRKIKASFVDQDLEDTATSPIHSPKVDELNCSYMSKEINSTEICQEYDSNHFQNEQTEDNSFSFSQEKQHSSEKPTGEGIDDMGFVEAELRRKGLCLVPMSLLLNYVH